MSDTIVYIYIVSDISPSEVDIYIYMGHTGSTSGGQMSGTAYCPYLPLEVRYHYQTVWAIPTSGSEMNDTV